MPRRLPIEQMYDALMLTIDDSHVHSVMGAFGLNGSILDAANLAWKVGLVAKDKARLDVLMPTYNSERRKHAVRIIEVSGSYLRFVCGSVLPLPNLRDLDALKADDERRALLSNGSGEPVVKLTNGHAESKITSTTNGTKQNSEVDGHHGPGNSQAEDLEFLGGFFKAHGQFLLGVDCPYDESAVASPSTDLSPASGAPPAIRVKNGVRVPNPRLCFSSAESGYLYDKLAGPPRFHLVLFASSLAGTEVRRRVDAFFGYLNSPESFYARFGGSDRFHVVVVLKMLPFEWHEANEDAGLTAIRDALPAGTTVLFDDRAPDEDAHTAWGANHLTGGVAVIRPDLWVALTAYPDEMEAVSGFFEGFLL